MQCGRDREGRACDQHPVGHHQSSLMAEPIPGLRGPLSRQSLTSPHLAPPAPPLSCPILGDGCQVRCTTHPWGTVLPRNTHIFRHRFALQNDRIQHLGFTLIIDAAICITVL